MKTLASKANSTDHQGLIVARISTVGKRSLFDHF
jgi:hypothetical protein